MKIVLIGKNGQLGWEFQRTLPVLGEVIALGRDDLDLSIPDIIEKSIIELKPDLIINTAAYTEVDLAESQVDLAMNVNAVAPGFIQTDMTEDLNAGELSKMIPMQRFGKPEEVADAIVFLASPKASYITASVVSINGGLYS